MRNKLKLQLVQELKDAIDYHANATKILPQASVVEVCPPIGRRKLEFTLRAQFEVGEWRTFAITLSERKKRP